MAPPGASCLTALVRMASIVFFGSFGSGMEKGANYTPRLVELDRIHVEMPVQRARCRLEKPRAPRGEKVLQGGARGRLHQKLRALQPGAAGDDVRHRVVDAHLGGNGDPPRPPAPEAHPPNQLFFLPPP